jgi:NAD(P)H-quinone oxidoreductase subunit 5
MTDKFFHFDQVSIVLSILITLISSLVCIFSKNYLQGEANQKRFFVYLAIITFSLILTAAADNLALFLLLWVINNCFLVLMMIHKSSWRESLNSGLLALKYFIGGFIALTAGFLILSWQFDSTSISQIGQIVTDHNQQTNLALVFILIAAAIQSAILPFHKWLLSSLNSPTPTSALMHAGLVNGGGILLTKFAPIYLHSPSILTSMFVIGIISSIVGTLWKLIQGNVKSMLACSTMSQMGFMIAQCGLGLFPAAIAHLFWHGMFKSYLFLTSPGSWQERHLKSKRSPKISEFIGAIFCGALATVWFAIASNLSVDHFDSTLFLTAMAFIASTQLSLTILAESADKNLISTLIISSALAVMYGLSIRIIENLMMPMNIFQPQPLNSAHLIALALLTLIWLTRLTPKFRQKFNRSKVMMMLYTKALNASQPDKKTITSIRQNYSFK